METIKTQKSHDCIHVPKSVFERTIIEILGSTAFITRLSSVNAIDVSSYSLVPTAFELLGYNWDEAPDKLLDRIISHVYFVVEKIKPFEIVCPEKMGKMILELWQTEFEMYNHNPKYYE